MKLFYITLIFFINIISSNLIAQIIVVVNVQTLIDQNSNYIDATKDIERSQKKYLKIFEEKEIELKKMLEEIEKSKLILNENEINTKIENYNNQLNIFSNDVDKFNFHYQNQIIEMRETLLKEIIILLENYAMTNNIDIILDSTSYLVASNSIDITEDIKKQLNNLKIVLKYENFEKN